jgi:hypothetical protein
MGVIQSSLFTITERFPKHKKTIRTLFRDSERFKSACDDYRRCAEALQHWRQSDSAEAPARREEYAALLQDLEVEILQSLMESQ